MWGSVEVDSDAMGSVRVCGMHTTISRRVRYITINHGVRIQHQPWVSIVDIYWYKINIEHVIFVGRVVEEGPDTTTHSLCLVSRGVYNRGEGFRQSEGGRVFYVGGEVVLWYKYWCLWVQMRQTTDFHALSTLCVGTESTLRDMSVNGTFGRRTTVVITEQNKYEYRIQFVIIKYRTIYVKETYKQFV